jgi:predicted alpha-1,6-mannanase (GH76 family)
MLLASDAYDACIGYFSDNLGIFEGNEGGGQGDLISDIVSDQVADMLLTFCQQQPQLSSATRMTVIADGDKLVDDIEQILGRFWDKPATLEQEQFIKEYFLLLKNSLDSQVPAHSI